MPTSPPKSTIRRILVAMDASTHGWEALEAAASLAAALQAELQGLLVEDESLFRAADLPCGWEIAYNSALPRRMQVEALARLWRAKADQMRQRLADTADPLRLQWSLRVTRGRITREGVAASETADLIVLGCNRPTPSRPPPTSAATLPCLLAVCQGITDVEHIMTAASTLAAGIRVGVVQLVRPWPPDQGPRRDVVAEAAQSVARHNLQLVIRDEPLVTSEDLVRLAHRLGPRLIVLGRHSPLAEPAALERVVSDVDCPVVIVR